MRNGSPAFWHSTSPASSNQYVNVLPRPLSLHYCEGMRRMAASAIEFNRVAYCFLPSNYDDRWNLRCHHVLVKCIRDSAFSVCLDLAGGT